MAITVGALAPRFVCATTSNPRYTSAAFGGRYVLLACALIFLSAMPR